MIASLGMFPFESVLPSYNELWRQLSGLIDWLPDALSPLDEKAWLDEQLAFSQTCGWPLVTTLAGRVRPVGSFALGVGTAQGWTQRSLIIGSDPKMINGLTAAVNGPESLSGWISLLRYAGVEEWPGEVIWSGSHAESARLVSQGEAQVAAIDSLSLAIMHAEGHYLDLSVIGQGPSIPTLPLITSIKTSDSQLAELRSALASIVSDRNNAGLMDRLMITGFAPLDLDDYVSTINP